MKQLIAASMVGIAAFGLVSCSGQNVTENAAATGEPSAVNGGAVSDDNLAAGNTVLDVSNTGNAIESNAVDANDAGSVDNATKASNNSL